MWHRFGFLSRKLKASSRRLCHATKSFYWIKTVARVCVSARFETSSKVLSEGTTWILIKHFAKKIYFIYSLAAIIELQIIMIARCEGPIDSFTAMNWPAACSWSRRQRTESSWELSLGDTHAQKNHNDRARSLGLQAYRAKRLLVAKTADTTI